MQRFHFFNFSRTTGKTPSRFTKKSELNLDLVFWGEMKTKFSLFRTKTTKTHLAGKIPFQIDFENRKKYLPNIIFVRFSRNTTRTHSFLTLVETLGDPKSVMLGHFSRNTIKTPARLPQNSSKSAMNGFLGPEVVPDEPRPGRRASLAGWPCLAARWAALLAWLAICLAGSGRRQQRSHPPTPITAGGL